MRRNLKVAPQICSDRVVIESALCDMFTTDSSGRVLGRPWLTVLVDGDEKTILAQTVTFTPPSTATVIELFEEFFAKYARMPKIVATDHSDDSALEEISRWLVQHGCLVMRRPPTRPPRIN